MNASCNKFDLTNLLHHSLINYVSRPLTSTSQCHGHSNEQLAVLNTPGTAMNYRWRVLIIVFFVLSAREVHVHRTLKRINVFAPEAGKKPRMLGSDKRLVEKHCTSGNIQISTGILRYAQRLSNVTDRSKTKNK